MLPVPRPLSSSSVHSNIRLGKEFWHVLYALLPPGGVELSTVGAVHGGGRVSVRGGRGLPVDVSGGGLPGSES